MGASRGRGLEMADPARRKEEEKEDDMNNANCLPIIEDEYTGQPPAKRLLAHLLAKRAKGAKLVGIFCGYVPFELIHAMGLVPVGLCAFSNATIEAAESVLPANLCPLVKSSFGFIIKDTCPFFGISDAVVGETTCDGKKKMFEIISGRKPMFVMDLPQIPDHPEALEHWLAVVSRLQGFLEKTFKVEIDDARLEAAIRDSNRKMRLMNRVFDYFATEPPVMGWNELYDILFLAMVMTGDELEPIIDGAIARLEERRRFGYRHGTPGSLRVMVSGCPIAGDSDKVLSIIEDAGGVIVALEACSGMKCYLGDAIEEGTGDPLRAIAARCLKIPCSCMTPNDRRLSQISALVDRFEPKAVVDVVLHACHSYNIESHRVETHLGERYGLPFLKIVTDYSDNDVGQIRTRVEALLETRR